MAGEVVEVNSALADNPALVNQSPYGDGWMVKIRPSNPAEIQGLMNHDDYARLIEEQHA